MKVPRNERSRERKFRRTFLPWERKFPGTNGLRNESSQEWMISQNDRSRERKVSGTSSP